MNNNTILISGPAYRHLPRRAKAEGGPASPPISTQQGGPASRQGGQALLTFLIFVLISLTITSAASVVSLINSQSSEKLEQGLVASQAAESGAENAMLRLLRDPSYSGETLTINTISVSITVTGSTTKTITSIATNGNFKRQIQVISDYTNNVLTVTSWKELF